MTTTLRDIHVAVFDRLSELAQVTVAPGLRPPEIEGKVLLYDLNLHRDAVMSGGLQGFWKGTLVLEAIHDDVLVCAELMDDALAKLNPKWEKSGIGGCVNGSVDISTLHDTPSDGRDDATRGIRASVPIIFKET